MNRYVLIIFLGLITFLTATGIHSIHQAEITSTYESVPEKPLSVVTTIPPNQSEFIEVNTSISNAGRLIKRVSEQEDWTTQQPSAPTSTIFSPVQTADNTPPDNSSIDNEKYRYLAKKLPPPLEMFSIGGISIFCVLFLFAVLLIRMTHFNIKDKPKKQYFLLISIAALVIGIIYFVESAQSSYFSEREVVTSQYTFPDFIDFILQQSEGLPPPLNDSSTLIRIIFYLVVFSLTSSFSIWVFVSTIKGLAKGLTSNPFDKKEKEREKEEKRDTVANKIEEYYIINMSQTVKSFWLSFMLIAAGFVVILFAICFSIAIPNLDISIKLIAIVSGVFLEFIGGTALLLYNKNIQYFSLFFDALNRNEEVEKAVELCKKLSRVENGRYVEYTQATRHIISHLASRGKSSNEIISNLTERHKEADKNDRKTSAER